jgi:hypothetical protein
VWTACYPFLSASYLQREGGESVAISLILAIIISAVVLYGLVRSRDKEAHHLDGLHIVGSTHPKKH